jgi:SAM-dependent methyltransferase
VKENATTWKALDIIYNYQPKQDKSIMGRVTDFWNGLRNIKAVRNRLRLIKKQLRSLIQKFAKEEKEIRLISIASGSAQGIIEIIKEFKQRGIVIKAIFLDLDPSAIEYSKNLAKKAGIIDQIIFINESARELENSTHGFNPHIIEVTGLFEYRPKERAIKLLERIHKLLVPGGVLLTSNIAPNSERLFSYWVANWPMIYRTPRQLCEIITKAGFNPKYCKIIQEPLRVHNVVICKKIHS